MSFAGSQAWWWPWLYITVAGVVANGAWRAAGVLIGDRLDENSEFMVLVRGIATALVARLLARAWERGARVAYLQVDAGNAPALAVYRTLGFSTSYEYHYRGREGECR